MKIIGITGGVGCGKSTVLQYFEEQESACVIQADLVAHELEEPGTEVYHEIVNSFGVGILNKTGKIDRQRLGGIVFSHADRLRVLNQIVHPAVKQEILHRIEEEKTKNQVSYVVVEAALFLEEKYDQFCDEVWYIDTNETNRRQRLQQSRGYSEEKITSMMCCQKKREEFLSRCDRVLDNNGEMETTYEQIRQNLKGQ